jgi:hypothetical protein
MFLIQYARHENKPVGSFSFSLVPLTCDVTHQHRLSAVSVEYDAVRFAQRICLLFENVHDETLC